MNEKELDALETEFWQSWYENNKTSFNPTGKVTGVPYVEIDADGGCCHDLELDMNVRFRIEVEGQNYPTWTSVTIYDVDDLVNDALLFKRD